MAAIDELIDKIGDSGLRDRIRFELSRIQKQRKFGLVYEEHLPEATPLYDLPIKKGIMVSSRGTAIKDFYRVINVDGENALCEKIDDTHEQFTFDIKDIVAVAQFGEPIYPYLKPVDSICNAPDSSLWHTLIEADNYHALQLLAYLYEGQVDCIYIDPPYNTGARDWKYNNDYVDGNDAYRHSKWLSMMEKRLLLAKRLLNPQIGVLIITIDEHEVHHLRTLLEQIYNGSYIQMITDVINPKGVTQNYFARVEEYIIYVFMPNAKLSRWKDSMLGDETFEESSQVGWASLLRRGSHSKREDRPKMYYPILIDEENNRVIKAGEIMPLNYHPNYDEIIDGYKAAWPVRTNMDEGYWSVNGDTLNKLIKEGYVSLGAYDAKRKTWAIKYLFKKQREQIKNGEIKIIGYNEKEQHVEIEYNVETLSKQIKTVWYKQNHDAGTFGSTFLTNVLGEKRFSFPKSLYSVKDSLGVIVGDNPNALILDFFAGSGTTLHAVNLLNAEDGGNRRCIMVTNNEVSEAEAKALTAKGYKAGDEEWEKLGIAHYVTWPRTKCSILGEDIKGNKLSGNYIGSDIPMSDGFKANASFFKLSFLDKLSVSLGRNFKELIPMLWMKAGAIGKCPANQKEEDYLILSENHFAVLVNDSAYSAFSKELSKHPEIEVAFIITDSEDGYREMISGLKVNRTYQLYRDYLDNFTINYAR